MLKKITIFILVVLFSIIGCKKDQEASELLEKSALYVATGKIVALGPDYIIVENQFGERPVIDNVTNIDNWNQLAETFLRDQTSVIIVYKMINGPIATIESMTEKK